MDGREVKKSRLGGPPGCYDLVGVVADRSFCDVDGVAAVVAG